MDNEYPMDTRNLIRLGFVYARSSLGRGRVKNLGSSSGMNIAIPDPWIPIVDLGHFLFVLFKIYLFGFNFKLKHLVCWKLSFIFFLVFFMGLS
jgi:hypothetical protein